MTRWEEDKVASWDKRLGFLSQLNCSHGIAPWENLSRNARTRDPGLPGLHPLSGSFSPPLLDPVSEYLFRIIFLSVIAN